MIGGVEVRDLAVAVGSAIERGVRFLAGEQTDEGEFPMLISNELYADADLAARKDVRWRHEPSPFFTSLVVNSLCSLPSTSQVEALRVSGCRFLREVRAVDGVWSWNVVPQGEVHFVAPDCDDTACALIALQRAVEKTGDSDRMLRLLDGYRHSDGRFLTWMPDRWDLPAEAEIPFVGFYRDLASRPEYRDLVEPCSSDYFEWLYVEDVEPITNLNVASFFALANRQVPEVARFVVEFTLSGSYRKGTVYYPSPTVFSYFYSRAAGELGVEGLEDGAGELITYLKSEQRQTTGGWGDALQSASAVCALINFGVRGRVVQRGVEAILAKQDLDGGWPLELFVWASPEYFKVPCPYHGARGLTTAFALEALAKFDRLSDFDRITSSSHRPESRSGVSLAFRR